MKHSGYVKIHRKIMDTSFYKIPLTCHLAEHLILTANHKDKEWAPNSKTKLVIRRGQRIASTRSLSKETGLTHRNVRTALAFLENCDFLTQQTTHHFSLITISNYDSYQKVGLKQDTLNDTGPTQARHTSDTLSDNKQEYKNEKNDKELAAAAGASATPQLIESSSLFSEKDAPNNERSKQKSPKIKKPPDPRIAEFIHYAADSYLKLTGLQLVVTGAKDGNNIKRLLGQFDLNVLTPCWDFYITANGQDQAWFIKQGYTISNFTSNFAKCLQRVFGTAQIGGAIQDPRLAQSMSAINQWLASKGVKPI